MEGELPAERASEPKLAKATSVTLSSVSSRSMRARSTRRPLIHCGRRTRLGLEPSATGCGCSGAPWRPAVGRVRRSSRWAIGPRHQRRQRAARSIVPVDRGTGPGRRAVRWAHDSRGDVVGVALAVILSAGCAGQRSAAASMPPELRTSPSSTNSSSSSRSTSGNERGTARPEPSGW